MRLPFVSRARFEDLQRQLGASGEERRRLLDLLLGDPNPRPQPAAVEETQPQQQAFTTPIDRVLNRFDRASGVDKARFKARMR